MLPFVFFHNFTHWHKTCISSEQQCRRGATMTCRIDRRVVGQDRTMLCISGRITEEDGNTLRALLEEEEGVVIIDLKDVLIVDREAIKLLAVCELNGVELRNCPAYIREWVTREMADRNSYKNRTKGTGGSEDA
jgi:hypothetical protein